MHFSLFKYGSLFKHSSAANQITVRKITGTPKFNLNQCINKLCGLAYLDTASNISVYLSNHRFIRHLSESWSDPTYLCRFPILPTSFSNQKLKIPYLDTANYQIYPYFKLFKYGTRRNSL